MYPVVNIEELGVSIFNESYSGEVGGFVGVFEKGVINQPIYITTASQFKTIFGRGNGIYENDWYQIYNYLRYSSGIFVTRSVGDGSTNSSNSTSEYLIHDDEDFFNNWGAIHVNNGVSIIANSAGEHGDLISVHIVNFADYQANINVFSNDCKSLFPFFREGNVGIVIARSDKIVEKYYVSIASLNSNTNVPNTRPFISQYIYTKFENFTESDNGLIELSGGVTVLPNYNDLSESHDIFLDKGNYILDNFIANDREPNLAIKLADSRKDMLAYIGLPVANVDIFTLDGDILVEDGNILVDDDSVLLSNYDLDDVKSFTESLIPSKFAVVVNNVKRQTNSFTGDTMLLNLAGDMAGLKSQASKKSIYKVGSGLINGQFIGMDKLHMLWEDDEVSEMEMLNINHINKNALITQRTFIDIENSESRINIRSLFNHLERYIENIATATLFEFSDIHTLSKIRLECGLILDSAKSDRAIDEYKIIVYPNDDSKFDDPNRIVIEIYVKPAYLIENAILRFYNNGSTTITNRGV